jgi:hypothetical protein
MRGVALRELLLPFPAGAPRAKARAIPLYSHHFSAHPLHLSGLPLFSKQVFLGQHRVRFAGIDFHVDHRFLHYFRPNLLFACQRGQGREGNKSGVDLKKSRSISLVSLRPKPSVPSETSGRGNQRAMESGKALT